MDVNKIISNATSSNFAKGVSKKVTALGNTISGAIKNHPKLDSFVRSVEPTNHDNAFGPLATLMVGTVIIPRVLTAAKRNPDDKEATKDEIKEILFRDVQTVAIILLLLKGLNSMVGNAATSLKGLPMVNKTYQKIFDNNVQGGFIEKVKANAKEFAHHPFDKLKRFGKNALDAFNPIGGSVALTNKQSVSKYSGYKSFSQIDGFLSNIEMSGGDKAKTFSIVMDDLIKKQDAEKVKVEGLGQIFDTKVREDLVSIKDKVIENFKNGKASGLTDLESTKGMEEAKSAILNFFKDPKNALVKKVSVLNAYMNAACLAIEAAYLGAGLPILNRMRLEKKYLKNGGVKQTESKTNTSNIASNDFLKKATKPQEVKLYQNFIKG